MENENNVVEKKAKPRHFIRNTLIVLSVILGYAGLFYVGSYIEKSSPPPVEVKAAEKPSEPKKFTICLKPSLGDTIEDIEVVWNKGLRIENDSCIFVGQKDAVGIIYGKGYKGYCFGSPPRAGQITAKTNGLFGVDSASFPTKRQFFNGIKELMPKDSVCTNAYAFSDSNKFKIYTFESETLARIPGIENTFPYKDKNKLDKKGTYFLMVTEDEEDGEYIVLFNICLGLPINKKGIIKSIDENPFSMDSQ